MMKAARLSMAFALAGCGGYAMGPSIEVVQQPACPNSKPCGNSCISYSDTCHKGGSGGGLTDDDGATILLVLSAVAVGGLVIYAMNHAAEMRAAAPPDDEASLRHPVFTRAALSLYYPADCPALEAARAKQGGEAIDYRAMEEERAIGFGYHLAPECVSRGPSSPRTHGSDLGF